MVRWVIGSIRHGGPTELFLVAASARRLVQQSPWYVLSGLWDDAYKIIFSANWKESSMWRHRVSFLAFLPSMSQRLSKQVLY